MWKYLNARKQKTIRKTFYWILLLTFYQDIYLTILLVVEISICLGKNVMKKLTRKVSIFKIEIDESIGKTHAVY